MKTSLCGWLYQEGTVFGLRFLFGCMALSTNMHSLPFLLSYCQLSTTSLLESFLWLKKNSQSFCCLVASCFGRLQGSIFIVLFNSYTSPIGCELDAFFSSFEFLHVQWFVRMQPTISTKLDVEKLISNSIIQWCVFVCTCRYAYTDICISVACAIHSYHNGIRNE